MTKDSGFSVHEREQLRAWLKLTPAQRLQWLVQAKSFAAKAQKAAQDRNIAKKDKMTPHED